MTNVAIIGAQWGDEGKGKIIDYLAPNFDFVIRYQGGPNTSHSVNYEGRRFTLSILPSGVFYPKTQNLIANGVVVEPNALIKEILSLQEQGVALSPSNLKISDRAHLILPYHGVIDRLQDVRRFDQKLITGGRGVGPAYEWKAARKGVRFCDLRHPRYLEKVIRYDLDLVHHRYRHYESLKKWNVEETLAGLSKAYETLEPYVVDGIELLAQARSREQTLLFEGIQASLLDIDFGTYPHVTASNSCVAGIGPGSGIPPASVHHIIGVVKAYATRIGSGPFPTELFDDQAERLREAGFEFVSSTGRPRRCGWLDLVALRYAHCLNGFSALALMKLDVFDSFDTIQVCEAYQLDGEIISFFPASVVDLERLKPVYRAFPGWRSATCDIRNFEDLPEEAKGLISFIEERVACPVGLVSVGPSRDQVIARDHSVFNYCYFQS